MLALGSGGSIFLVAGTTDLRKSFNGLSGIVVNHLERDPVSGEVFLFSNRRRDRVKALFWDGSGLWVCAKRLEKGTFSWPQTTEKSMRLTPGELTLLLSGIDLKETRKRRWYRRDFSKRKIG